MNHELYERTDFFICLSKEIASNLSTQLLLYTCLDDEFSSVRVRGTHKTQHGRHIQDDERERERDVWTY